MSSTPMA